MKYLWPGVIIVLVILLGIGAIMLVNMSVGPLSKEHAAPATQTQPSPTSSPSIENQNNQNKMTIEDIKRGTGVEAKNGDTVSVQYTGTLLNGTKFDSSYDHGQPFSFTLGQSQVIQGWDQGVLGMKIGGKRKLTIPPSLAYGERGAGNVIPPNATLVFEIELLGVK